MQVRSEQLDVGYSIQIFESISLIEPNKWNSINEHISFYQQHEFLEVIERIHKDLLFRYVLITKEDKIIAALYVQLLNFSYKNLVNYSDSRNLLPKKILSYSI